MIGNYNINEYSTMYDYCKRIVLLYEMESNLYELGYGNDEGIRDEIIKEIIEVQDMLRTAVIKNKI